jgi:cytochrome c oxidase subunit III
MALAETEHGTDTHAEHGHPDHAPFIAHHFDGPEQQFDAGKLGIWVFLVTEVLFFSGLFVAYTLWRSHHPEIFEQAHVFLDKVLGGINTVVLLFSSLTMAWGVRSAMLGNNRNVALMVLITMVCAAVFLGIKAVEYSHKWDLGIKVAGQWLYTATHAAPEGPLAKALGVSDWLVTLSIIPTITLVAFAGVSVFLKLTGQPLWSKFFAGMVVMNLGYFLGAVGGQLYMKATEGGTGGHAVAVPHLQQASLIRELDAEQEAAAPAGGTQDPAHTEDHAADSHAAEPAAGQHAEGETAHDHPAGAGHAGDPAAHTDPHLPDPNKLDRDVGIFFSIYYCMTGLHAFHILGGIAFLSWIYFRSLRGDWRPDYFGPVDYVGLYWHLVDLIWIYLFPLLYLID